MENARVGVVGLGVIGLKLVEYLALEGHEVVAYNWRNVKVKEQQLSLNLDKKVKYEKVSLELLDRVKSRIRFVEDLQELSSCGLVIDSSREDYDVKKGLYSSLLKKMSPKAILASTTSSLSLQKLSDYFDKDRFVGIHFFNPPTKMKLVEVAFLDPNNRELYAEVYKFLKALPDKKVVELPPIQGYIVNRLLFVYINAAIAFHEEFNISPQSIDEAMRFGTNVPMGPLELSDYIGNDVTLEILKEFHSALNDVRYKPATALVKLVEEGKLGKKTKSGFYKY